MDEQLLREMFEQSQAMHNANANANATGNNKVKFSEEEASRFKKAFADPKFREMFSEYMDEIQDPKYRQETEQYISQLEGEQRVPEGKELIRPIAGFVAKTYKKMGDSTKDKLFLNIVQSDKIAKPSKQSTSKGDHWSVPYSLGPPHMEKDKKGENATCFDCCFNPEALTLSERNGEFKKLLVNTATEGVKESYKRMNQSGVVIESEFHIVKGISYKEGMIPTMMIASSSKENWKSSSSSSVNTAGTSVSFPVGKKATSSSSSSGEPSTASKHREDPPASNSDDEKSSSQQNSKHQQSSSSSSSSPTSTSPVNASEKSATTVTSEDIPKPNKAKSTTVIKRGFLNSNKSKELYPEKIPTIRPKTITAEGNNESSLLQDEQQQKMSNYTNEIDQLGESLTKTLTFDNNQKKSSSFVGSDATNVVAIADSELKAVATKRKPVEKKPPVVSASVSETVVNKEEEKKEEEQHFPIGPQVICKHREEINLGDFEGVNKNDVISNRPSELIYEIQLPLVTTPSKIILDVAEKSLKLSYLQYYLLDMKLPYSINDKKGKAAYDKQKKILKVTLPVIAPRSVIQDNLDDDTTKPKQINKNSAVQVLKEEQDESSNSNDQSEEKGKSSASNVSKLDEKSHKKWIEKSSLVSSSTEREKETDEESKKFYEEIKQKAELAKNEAIAAAAVATTVSTKANANGKNSKTESSPAVDESNATTTAAESREYIPSVKFIGSKKGYYFSMGEKGLGYYLDNKQSLNLPAPPASEGKNVDENQSHLNKTKSKEGKSKDLIEEKPKANEEKGEVTVKEYKFPKVDIKQTKAAVSIIIQVPFILKESVSLKSSSNYILDVKFKALEDNNNNTNDTKATSSEPVSYGVRFTLSQSLCSEGFQQTTITHDVASKNMVIILLKINQLIYEASEHNQDKDSSNWITTSPLRNEENIVPPVPPAPQMNSNSPEQAKSASSKKKEVKTIATEAFKSTVNALQFSTDFISELD